MFRRAFAVLPVLFALAACRTAADEPVVNTIDPAVRADDELGAPCRPGGGVNGIEPCGSKQRISMRFVSHSMGAVAAKALPCTLAKRDASPGMSVTACVADGTLYASADCMMCRVPGSGWNAIAKLDELTPGQATALQARLGISSDAPLRGEKAWTRALAGGAHAELRDGAQGDASTSRLDDVAAATLVLASR
jgi:hypothetical protein